MGLKILKNIIFPKKQPISQKFSLLLERERCEKEAIAHLFSRFTNPFVE